MSSVCVCVYYVEYNMCITLNINYTEYIYFKLTGFEIKMVTLLVRTF